MPPRGCLNSLSLSLVIIALHARFCDFGFTGGNEEAFDWLAGGASADHPCVSEVTGLRQLEGLAGERRQGGKVVLFENENVSTRIYPVRAWCSARALRITANTGSFPWGCQDSGLRTRSARSLQSPATADCIFASGGEM